MTIEHASQIIHAVKESIDRSRFILLTGDVTSDAPFEVTLLGDTSPVASVYRLASYTPTVGDRVLLARVGSAWIVVGKVV